MVLEVNGLQLTSRFLRPGGVFDDNFTIDKSAPATIQPRMEIARTATGAVISWPTSLPAFSLFTASSIPSAHWESLPQSVTRTGRRNSVPISISATNRFFQLRVAP
jgi:hypothetical protein